MEARAGTGLGNAAVDDLQHSVVRIEVDMQGIYPATFDTYHKKCFRLHLIIEK